MALQLKFAINLGNDCKSFDFVQNTGSYSVSNTTGWGTPNPATSDVATAVLSIENLTTSTVYDDLTVTVSSTVGNETTFTTEDLEIDGVSIGDVLLPDGQYCFTFTVTLEDETVYQQQVKKVFLCQSCCKIKQKACSIDLRCGCCNDPCAEEIWNFLQAWTELKIIEYSAYCGTQEEINDKIKSLQSLLSKYDCKTCN